MKRKLLRCMTALSAMLFASCTSELALEGVPQAGVDGEEVEVTFSVSALSANSSMRDAEVGGPGQWQKYIGRGQEIDMLIYAVYEDNTNAAEGKSKYTLLKQYSQGIASSLSNKPAIGETEHDGQTVLDVSKTIQQGKAESITLRLMRNKTYHIAFWAQSSETTAYNTENLEEVMVNYDNALNNDETRDAFCKVESFSVSTSGVDRNVILTRPLAQINVGTTGADYNYVINNISNRKVTRSSITLANVAQYFNVVEDKVLIDQNKYLSTEVTFELNRIPAYIEKAIPDGTNLDELLGGTDIADTEGYRDTEGDNETEEFLRVNLDGDKEIKKYKIKYPTIGAETDKGTPQDYFLTETFKYLSMCYVLVEATQTDIPNYDAETSAQGSDDSGYKDPYNSTLLTVKAVQFAERDTDSSKYTSIQDLANVPVHRNWRTNILCGLYHPDSPVYPEDPGDNPDDPSSIVKKCQILVSMDSNYQGEYNTTDEGTNWTDNNGNTWQNWSSSSGSDEE